MNNEKKGVSGPSLDDDIRIYLVLFFSFNNWNLKKGSNEATRCREVLAKKQ